MSQSLHVGIIGGGAAGIFAAICVRENHPEASVTVHEQSKKLLSKVKISGGGRCNVTNGTCSRKELVGGYPRGTKLLKKGFQIFDNQDIMSWFEARGVRLKTENDLRVFPVTDDSQTIIDCLLTEAKKLGVEILYPSKVLELISTDTKLEIKTKNEKPYQYDKVIVASGGTPKKAGFDWLENLGHKIIAPSPSLFTFNMPDESIKELMGVVAENVKLSIQGSKLKADGPLLITHWGMSGPAVLKLSSFGARDLADLDYQFVTQVNWTAESNNESIREYLNAIVNENPAKQLQNVKPYQLPSRLWNYLITRSMLALDKRWDELGKKGINKLVTMLSNDCYQVKGKTTFKEEFVTAGGVSLDSINQISMQSLVCPNLYFAGEVLDIDGITGGYNFQAAWTTAYLTAKLC